jgi:hypothetical protein
MQRNRKCDKQVTLRGNRCDRGPGYKKLYSREGQLHLQFKSGLREVSHSDSKSYRLDQEVVFRPFLDEI